MAEGKQVLLKLSKGDMHCALNILQACHAAYELTGEAGSTIQQSTAC